MSGLNDFALVHDSVNWVLYSEARYMETAVGVWVNHRRYHRAETWNLKRTAATTVLSHVRIRASSTCVSRRLGSGHWGSESWSWNGRTYIRMHRTHVSSSRAEPDRAKHLHEEITAWMYRARCVEVALALYTPCETVQFPAPKPIQSVAARKPPKPHPSIPQPTTQKQPHANKITNPNSLLAYNALGNARVPHVSDTQRISVSLTPAPHRRTRIRAAAHIHDPASGTDAGKDVRFPMFRKSSEINRCWARASLDGSLTSFFCGVFVAVKYTRYYRRWNLTADSASLVRCVAVERLQKYKRGIFEERARWRVRAESSSYRRSWASRLRTTRATRSYGRRSGKRR